MKPNFIGCPSSFFSPKEEGVYFTKNILFVLLEHGVLECAFEMVVFRFVKSVHVELSNKTVNFIVSEVSRQDNFLKFLNVFDCELCSVRLPVYDFSKVYDLTMKKNVTLRI